MLALITCAGANAQKYLGGDISLLPTYREKGTTYKTADGKEKCPYKLFTEAGWNAMRVRLFVEPDNAPQGNKDEGVCQDLPYVIKLCKQIKAHGFKLMLDFHYSDTWADPGKQFTPKAWDEAIAGKSKDEQVKILADSVYAHTLNALNALKQAGAEPEPGGRGSLRLHKGQAQLFRGGLPLRHKMYRPADNRLPGREQHRQDDGKCRGFEKSRGRGGVRVDMGRFHLLCILRVLRRKVHQLQ